MLLLITCTLHVVYYVASRAKLKEDKACVDYLTTSRYVIVIHWVPRDYGSKRTESEGVARGQSLFMLP